MKKIRPVHIVATLAICAGLFWIYAFHPFQITFGSPFPNSYAFLIYDFLSMLLFTTPGILGVFFGWKVLRENSKENIKWVMAGISLMSIVPITRIVQYCLPELNEELGILYIAISSLFALPLYIFGSQLLMKSSGFEHDKAKEFISRNILFLFSLQLFIISVNLLQYFSFDQAGLNQNKSGDEFFFAELINLLPFVIPIIFYNVSIWLLEIEPRRKMFSRKIKSGT